MCLAPSKQGGIIITDSVVLWWLSFASFSPSLSLSLSSGIPQELWACQLAASHRPLKALCPVPCPSHTPSRPLSRTLLTPRPLGKIQSSHQRVTESSIQTTNCSHTHTNTHIQIHTHAHIHTHACLCCLMTGGGRHGKHDHSDRFPRDKLLSDRFTVSDWQVEVPKTTSIHNSLANWLPPASSHSKEEEEYNKEDAEWIAARYSNQSARKLSFSFGLKSR